MAGCRKATPDRLPCASAKCFDLPSRDIFSRGHRSLRSGGRDSEKVLLNLTRNAKAEQQANVCFAGLESSIFLRKKDRRNNNRPGKAAPRTGLGGTEKTAPRSIFFRPNSALRQRATPKRSFLRKISCTQSWAEDLSSAQRMRYIREGRPAN